MRYSIVPRDRIYIKGYGFLSFAFLSFAKNVSNISIVKTSWYCQKNLQQMQQKLLQRQQFKKTAEASGDLIGNKIADEITKTSKTLQSNLDEAKNETEILKKRYILQKKDKKLLLNWGQYNNIT